MRKTFLAGVLCGFVVLTQTRAQEVEVPRESNAKVATSTALPEQPKTQTRAEQTNISQPPELTAEQMRKAGSLAAERVKRESQSEQTSTPGAPQAADDEAGNCPRSTVRSISTRERTNWC